MKQTKIITERQETLLIALVHEYIQSGEPVGSSTLVRNYKFPVSTATIRHELSHLEDLGFLVQPHTSAGRVPTQSAYRIFVDKLTNYDNLETSEKEVIENYFLSINEEFEDLLEKTIKLLAKLTTYVSLVMTPVYERSDLKRIDLIKLSSHNVLILIITTVGHILKKNMTFEAPIDDPEIERCEKAINKYFGGRSYSYIRDNQESINKMLHTDIRGKAHKIIAKVLESLIHNDNLKIFYSGTANIFRQPEFFDVQKVNRIMEFLEESKDLLSEIREIPSSVEVRVGIESLEDTGLHLSIVLGGYKQYDRYLGAIGLMGPQRMNYERAMSLVKISAESLSKKLENFS